MEPTLLNSRNLFDIQAAIIREENGIYVYLLGSQRMLIGVMGDGTFIMSDIANESKNVEWCNDFVVKNTSKGGRIGCELKTVDGKKVTKFLPILGWTGLRERA